MTTSGKIVRKEKTGIKRIILIEDDNSETIINITENVHYLLGFCKSGKNASPMEILVSGHPEVVGEIYYQIGDQQPELIQYCVKRATEKTRAQLKERGIDPGAEAFRNARPVGGTQ